jgi:phosphatidylinositol alpha-1,6-mannosyltransferase
MRVLVIADVFPPRTGGSGRWMWELYRRLRGFEILVAAGQADDAAAFDRDAPLDVRRVPLRFPSWGIMRPAAFKSYLRAWRQLRLMAAEFQPTVVHCAKALPEGLLALALRRVTGVPYLCYAHGEELTLALTSRELGLLTRWVLNGAVTVVANSRFTERLLVNEWAVPRSKVMVLHPGVDTNRFQPAERDDERRRQLGWEGRRVILTVGALQKRKGQDMLIRALPAILGSHPSTLYAVAGEGWEFDDLQALVKTTKTEAAVQFLGKPPDAELVACLQQCDVFALPNRQVGWDVEGFGIALLEAQACGRPVIAGQSGGAPETLVPGVTGEAIDCNSADSIARAVTGLLGDDDRRQRMGHAGRDWVVSQFDWSVLVEQAEQLFLRHTRPRESRSL